MCVCLCLHISVCVSLSQLLSVDKDHLKKKGMTEGAAKKLILKIEELK